MKHENHRQSRETRLTLALHEWQMSMIEKWREMQKHEPPFGMEKVRPPRTAQGGQS